jgi:hypothetical protein
VDVPCLRPEARSHRAREPLQFDWRVDSWLSGRNLPRRLILPAADVFNGSRVSQVHENVLIQVTIIVELLNLLWKKHNSRGWSVMKTAA